MIHNNWMIRVKDIMIIRLMIGLIIIRLRLIIELIILLY